MNPRKPEALRTGHHKYAESITPSKRPIVAPPLSAAAQVVWSRVLPLVEDLDVMTQADTEALAVLCELLAMHHASPNPKVAAQARAYLSQFGLTPASRAAFAKTPDKPHDALAEFNLD